MASIGTLTAIAVERFCIISRPYLSESFSLLRAAIVITGVWLYALTFSLPPLVGWNRYIVEYPYIACSVDWFTTSLNNTSYIIFIFLAGYVAPVTIIVVCYCRVVCIVRKSPKLKGQSSAARAERRVTVMVAAMIVCTLTAWTPYAVVSLLVTLGYAYLIGPVTAVSPSIFAKSSVIYNPIVYFFLNSQIKEAILNTICHRFQRPRAVENTGDTNACCTHRGTIGSCTGPEGQDVTGMAGFNQNTTTVMVQMKEEMPLTNL